MSESLGSGTYEVLRGRLREAAEDLHGRFEKLNQARSQVFGNIETKLTGTAHATTDNNCVPRDLLSFGDRLLLGYNVQFGLKTTINASDVFSLYRLEGDIAHPIDLDVLFNEDFRRDFRELYRFYKNTTFLRYAVIGPFVYFVFQVGKTEHDIKAFKWAIDGDSLRYVDNRSDQEVIFPDQHGFRWQRATREQHRSGLHPHVSIDDIVFVECVGGDLTIKVDDNTEDGVGIYSEPVDDADQTLDDAEVLYAVLGNLVLLKMRPYQEREYRHFAFSIKQQKVVRLDQIRRSCVLLPDDHGIIFPGGVCLQSGEYKLFDHGLENLAFDRSIAAPNGEDYLYLFLDPATGTYLQLRYNVISQEVDTPLVCHGQAFFDDGHMVTFRGDEQPQKHHSLQIWQTPFVGPNYKTTVNTESTLYKIGNRELVRGMSECQELLHLIDRDDSYSDLYVDLEKRATDIIDSYFWINRDDAMKLSEPIAKIRDTANAAVEEFDKVVRVRRQTEEKLVEAQQQTKSLLAEVSRTALDSIDSFVKQIAAIRQQRGSVIGLRDLKYIDLAAVEPLETSLSEASDRLGNRCVQFLLKPDALNPYRRRIGEAEEVTPNVESAAEGRELEEEIAEIGGELELLIETVSQLKIDDLTQRTAIADETGNLLADLNRVRSGVKARVRDLLSGEMEADYASQTKLLDQAAAGALETADTPERVDEALTRMMLQLEELEGRFAEFDTLVERLTEKRESIYEAFETRREQLVEARSRRAESLAAAAGRILEGIQGRAMRQRDADALRAYFASDPMVDKVRQIAEQLGQLGDSVRMDDLTSRLKAIADDSQRQLQDRADLFVGGDDQIKFGKHFFNVNTQPVELTTVVRDGSIKLHLTGTQFYETMTAPELEASKDLWSQHLPTENESVYRAEYLAFHLARQLEHSDEAEVEYLSQDAKQRKEWIRNAMQQMHDGGFSRGVHDADTEKFLSRFVETRRQLGLLNFSPRLRAVAFYAWTCLVAEESRQAAANWSQGFSVVAELMPRVVPSGGYEAFIARELEQAAAELLLHRNVNSADAAKYLFAILRQPAVQFVASPRALEIATAIDEYLPAKKRAKLHETLEQQDPGGLKAWILATDAAEGYIRHLRTNEEDIDPAENYLDEVVALLLTPRDHVAAGPAVEVACTVDGLVGDHPRISGSKARFHFHDFRDRLAHYQDDTLPRYRQLKATKHKLLTEAASDLKVEDFRPRVLTSFVRNRLIDEVYLPLVGDNLAKQMGAAGEAKRSDRMGLLLLISPPGYGKTTLMEYIANRLGIVFVKVNGPALGHSVTSLDPAEANNASAREEVEKINLALEMGDNVMLYLDDIQHCNAELLQKFIPLCDATRRIEGVWKGKPKTYDLRGRKVCVVMAGNPYTESGDRFQIPDMLSNRADVYNLGEIIGDSRDAFELSYIENALTSNPVLQTLSRASRKDQLALFNAARRQTMEGMDLTGNLSADQVSDIYQVLTKLMRARDVVLKVNRAYIQSASQADSYRTEPPFKLQGSYRNMNRIAEKIVPVMNDDELRELLIANYEQDAQTLTRDGESNLLKFYELLGEMSPEQSSRWEQIKYAYVEGVRMQGVDGEDSAAQLLRSLTGLRDGLESIRRTIEHAVSSEESIKDRTVLGEGLEQLSQNVSHLGEAVSQQVQAAALELKQLLDRANSELPEQKVLVQHSVPRVMTDLVRSQFQLLYDGLRPALEASALSRKQLEQLQKSIDECLSEYRDLQAEIERSEKDD